MAKTSKEQIKKDEEKILAKLQQDSHESIDKIAKSCKFSRQKIWRTIKHLEKNKTIWGYTVVTDDEQRKLKTFFVLIKRSRIPLTEQFADKIIIRKIEDLVPSTQVKILDSMYIHGAYDWIISFTASDIREAKKFCETLNRFYEGYISEILLLETLFPIKKQGIYNPEAKN